MVRERVNYPKWGKNENPGGNEDGHSRHFTPRHFISDDAVCRQAFHCRESKPWQRTAQGTRLPSSPPKWGGRAAYQASWTLCPAEPWLGLSCLPAPTCLVRWQGGPLPTPPHLSSWPVDLSALRRSPPLAKDALLQRCGSSSLAARMMTTGPGRAQRWDGGRPRMARRGACVILTFINLGGGKK